jgi:hypothetical protein
MNKLTTRCLDDLSPWPCMKSTTKTQTKHSTETASPRSRQLLKNWVSVCLNEHTACNEYQSTSGPQRLLLIDSPSYGFAHLVECDKEHTLPYLALSHCWGSSKHSPVLKTTKENLSFHKSGIRCTSMSKTFQDATEICRELDHQYVWIDSLCIVQDSAEEWQTELARMQAIYEGAVLVLSAMSARDGRGGCWVSKERNFNFALGTSYIDLTFSRIKCQENKHTSFIWPEAETDLDFEYPLATRKWALQERLLSRRIVHITAQDLVWECRGCMIQCTCGRLDKDFPIDTLKKSFHVGAHDTDDVLGLSMAWMDVVTTYSNANLSCKIAAHIFPMEFPVRALLRR